MKPESLTEAELQARMAYFQEEREIGEKHVRFAESQIAKCADFLMGQLQFEFN